MRGGSTPLIFIENIYKCKYLVFYKKIWYTKIYRDIVKRYNKLFVLIYIFKMFYTYISQPNKDGKLYIGSREDIEIRLVHHN